MKAIAIALLLVFGAAPVYAKKRHPPEPAPDVKKKKTEAPLPSPNDKGQNEGAQGRRNATDDAAGQADAPAFQHRP